VALRLGHPTLPGSGCTGGDAGGGGGGGGSGGGGSGRGCRRPRPRPRSAPPAAAAAGGSAVDCRDVHVADRAVVDADAEAEAQR